MGVFQDINYCLANSLPPDRQEQLEYALSKNGAIKADVTTATHIIANSPYFEGCENIKEDRAIVSDYWVDRSLILGKMQPVQYYSVDPAMLFSGIVACASDLPTADLEVLSAGITALGGQWRAGLTNDVTHLFAVRPDSLKYQTALAHRESTGIRIILPHWFDDSVRLGLRDLPVHAYSWPDPPYLKEIGINDVNALGAKEEEDKTKLIMMATANVFTPTVDSKVPVPRNVDLMPVKKGIWNGKRILLSWTLTLYTSRRQAVEASIRRAGGEILRYPGDDDSDISTEEKETRRDKKEARAIRECDILITRWRYGKAYGKGFRLHKTIGTLAWLYHVQSTGTTPRPVDQLLHYPLPKKPIEGFSAHEITVTNYTGEAREYIKRLITAMGATFTPSMTGRNTVLIAAYTMGVKADKARAWSIPVVNHTWLEDCFIQWRLLTPATEKYIIFPPGIDFSKLLGERGVGIRGVELCEEEEGRDGGSGSEEEDVDGLKSQTNAKPEYGDKVLIMKSADEDIDMISMPDTDGTGRETTHHVPESSLKKTTEGAREVSESVSPAKRSRDSAHISPSKRDSPSKAVHKRTADDHKGNEAARMDIDGERAGIVVDEARGAPRKMVARTGSVALVPMDVDGKAEEVTQEPVTPSKKAKPKDPAGSTKKQKLELLPDLELSDEDELDKTPEFYKPSSSRTVGRNGVSKGKDGGDGEERISGKSGGKEVRREESGAERQSDASPKRSPRKPVLNSGRRAVEEETTPAPPPGKKRLIRRLDSEKSLQLAREKEENKEKQAEASNSSRKLVRRTGSSIAQDTDAEKERSSEGEREGSEGEKEGAAAEHADMPKARLLKMTRGDARTRVKAKGAKAKARELYSDSEDEVVGIVDTKATKVKSKKQVVVPTKGKRGRKPKQVTPEEAMSPESEESDESEEQTESPSRDGKQNSSSKKPPSSSAPKGSVPYSTPLRQRVSVVVNPPPSIRALSAKAKGKTAVVVSSSPPNKTDEESDSKSDSSESSRERRVNKSDSIRVEAREKASAKSTSRSKPTPSPAKPVLKSRQAPASSPLSVIHTPNTDTSELPAKRGAATKAEQKLKVMMPDASRFELEMKKARKSGGSGLRGIEVGSWDREKDVGAGSKKKRTSEEAGAEDDAGGERKRRRQSGGKVKVEEVENSKETGKEVISSRVGKAKKRVSDQGIAAGKIYLMTTQVTLPDTVVKSLEKMGVTMTAKPSQCTHLIAPHLVRTEKFLCALSNAPYILDSSWATKSVTAKQLLPETGFLLHDPAAESKYGMKLNEALLRAKNLKGKLFSGKTFYVTPKTKVDFKLLKSVVTAHGGQLINQSPTLRVLNGNPDRHAISSPEEASVWRPLAAQDIPIYTHEFLLIGVLKQELEWDKPGFRVEGSV